MSNGSVDFKFLVEIKLGFPDQTPPKDRLVAALLGVVL